MPQHRFQLWMKPVASAPATPARVGLMACPNVFLQNAAPAQLQWMQSVYREALERAMESMRPHWLRPARAWQLN